MCCLVGLGDLHVSLANSHEDISSHLSRYPTFTFASTLCVDTELTFTCPLVVSNHSIVRFDTTSIPSGQSPTIMNDHNRISTMRVSRKSYQGAGSPFGLWTLPDPLDGPSFAPCYAPYGEQSPPIVSHPAVEQAATVPTTDNDARKAEGLKPWEKGSKTGKKIKTGRGPKGRPRAGEQSNVGSKDAISSSNGSTENANSVPGSRVSTVTTSALSSSRPSPLSSVVSDPMRDAAPRRPRFRLLAPAAPVDVYPADTAEAAIAESRKRNFDRVDNEVPAPSSTVHKKE
ncbi:hypothetical protein M436DRAFT_60645 [Aureobasidium namibiae CBS 147.97]|uniref:Uncharacterized protein n=1 Tax=Aureobasidium namibiae CBS 147.97 TaxID=1043004 RepID=A0A074WZB8_9PEZI